MTELGIYLDWQKNLQGTAYNIPLLLPLPAGTDPDRLKEALTVVLKAHVNMLSHFSMESDGTVVRLMPDPDTARIDIQEFKGEPEKDQLIRPFSDPEGDLYRLAIIHGEDGDTLFADFHHILVRTRKHDSDCPHLVWSHLPLDASCADAVAYRFGTVGHSIRELHQFTVEMCTCRVCVLGCVLTFYVVGCARVSRAFRFVDLNAYISHAYFSFSGLTIWFVGFRLLRSCRMANRGVQRGVTPLAHWGIFSGACTA